jgi:hypothetical protein
VDPATQLAGTAGVVCAPAEVNSAGTVRNVSCGETLASPGVLTGALCASRTAR